MFYIIEEGRAVVTKTIEQGKSPHIVMNYSKGSYFGELALIKEAKRAANVIAEVNYFSKIIIIFYFIIGFYRLNYIY
jgi:hypothetical protein